MTRIAFLCLSVLALSGLAAAQCSDLSISGSLGSGGNIDFNVTGAPADSLTVILIAENTGSTTIGGIDVGLEFPFIPIAIGTSDSNGDFAASFSIPSVPAGSGLGDVDLHAQALTLDFGGIPPGLTACASDVEMFTLAL